MFARFFNNNTNSTATVNAPFSIDDLRNSVSSLTNSISAGLTYTGDACHFDTLCAEADTINADIIANVFATVNIAARLTGIIGMEQTIGNITANLPSNPSKEDIGVMFANIQNVLNKEYERSVKYKKAENIAILKELCDGKSLYTYAYAAICNVYGRVESGIKGHMPKVEFKSKFMTNFANAVHTVGKTLHDGVRLVLKGISKGLSYAAALTLQVGRILTHVIRNAVDWVRNHFPRITIGETVIDAPFEELECSDFEYYKAPFIGHVSGLMANVMADPNLSSDAKLQYQQVQTHILMALSAMELLPDDNQDKVNFTEIMRIALDNSASLLDIDTMINQ